MTRTINGALRTIASPDAELGRYLAAIIKTGTFCSYNPEARVAVNWRL